MVKKKVKKNVKPKNDKVAEAFGKIKEEMQFIKVVLGIVALIDLVLVIHAVI